MKRQFTRIVYRTIKDGKTERIIADYAVTINIEDIWIDIELYGGCLIKDNRGYILKVNPDMSIVYRWNKWG